ncbi:unnamed protein product [Lactuca virosa]|uniref:Replication protein A OB domain-containing protein n=1 Tax=Lactuca virosa TaxID=75947 RepID=A0AAU9M0P5_9ASTR|nr:unnamed protein product [Lactuca virosa]
MATNNADRVVFDKVAEIDASKESWNIHVKVVLLWKQTYKNNPNMVGSLDMILIDQQIFLVKVVSTDPMRVIDENGREKRLMNLVAQDLSGTKITVALWDSFALKQNTYISQHHNETAPVIILLRLAKLKIWGGMDFFQQIIVSTSNLNALDMNVESSSRTSQLNSDTVVANLEDSYLHFQIKNIDEIPDWNKEVGLICIQT